MMNATRITDAAAISALPGCRIGKGAVDILAFSFGLFEGKFLDVHSGVMSSRTDSSSIVTNR